ncbi:uncharacterized protein LOC119498734 [Sebastes umbrosus]|uniref:uncharacterized protein LOC119498734 n=1 Tax=Sebastes umbrosus TaxID=72105 RepID=UPI00189EC6D1|nr:uncharacterized protein LOC119498734 [Sebastes umbrosus]
MQLSTPLRQWSSLLQLPPRAPQSSRTQSRRTQDSRSQPLQTASCSRPGGTTAEGYEDVVRLADSLVELRHYMFATHAKAQEIVALWQKLPAQDKQALDFPARHRDKQPTGKYKVSYRRTTTCVGFDSLRRSWLWRRVTDKLIGVRHVCVRKRHRPRPVAQHQQGSGGHLCPAVLGAPGGPGWGQEEQPLDARPERLHHKKRNVITNEDIMTPTRLQLFKINQRTLTQWYDQRGKAIELRMLEQYIPASIVSMDASSLLPHARPLLGTPQKRYDPLAYEDPENTTGQGVVGQREVHPPSPPSTTTSSSSHHQPPPPPAAATSAASSLPPPNPPPPSSSLHQTPPPHLRSTGVFYPAAAPPNPNLFLLSQPNHPDLPTDLHTFFPPLSPPPGPSQHHILSLSPSPRPGDEERGRWRGERRRGEQDLILLPKRGPHLWLSAASVGNAGPPSLATAASQTSWVCLATLSGLTAEEWVQRNGHSE